MKSLRYFILSALLLAVGVSTTGDAFAQKGPGRGRGGHLGDSTKVRPDSIRPPKDPRDTAFRKGDRPEHKGSVHEIIGFLMHNDSCRDVLLSQMSADDAAQLTSLLGSLTGGEAQLKDLRNQLRAAREAGDTTAFRAISEQLKGLYRQIGDNHKAIAELLGKYEAVARRVREECGGRPPKKPRDGGARDERKGDPHQPHSVITPNPVPVGGTAVLNVNLVMESNVSVTVTDQSGAVLTIPAALLGAGEHQIALDVSGLARGAYLVQLQIGDKVQVLKLMIN